MISPAVISALARSLLAGEPTVDDLHARAMRTLGRPWRWLRPLAVRYVETFGGRARPRRREVIQFLLQDRGFQRACVTHRETLSVAEWLLETPRMLPVEAARGWNLPAIETIGDLARWLSLHVANPRGA